MYDSVYIGAVPAEEECQQANTDGYDANEARKECNKFRNQLETMFGPLRKELGLVQPETANFFARDKAYFSVKHNRDGDTGYYSVEVFFDPDVDIASGFAIFVENNSPAKWSDDHVYTLAEFDKWRSEEDD
jgi:hypothetical protein